MYSFTRVWMGPKLAMTEMVVSSVVRTTSSRLMPSMPSWYWMPKNGIQATDSVNRKPPASTGASPKPTAMSSDSPSATSAVMSATRLTEAHVVARHERQHDGADEGRRR